MRQKDKTISPSENGGDLSILSLICFALTCGIAAANSYYNQPLLIQIAQSLNMSQDVAAIVPTLTQLGIAAGMLLLLPLGDRLDNRRMVSLLLGVQAAMLAVMAFSTSRDVFLISCIVAGSCGIVTFLIPAYASRLVPPNRRGAVTGVLATGNLVGIMLARSVAGMAGYEFGWQAVYLVAALATTATAAMMQYIMVATPEHKDMPYGRLLLSLVHLFATFGFLRRALLIQALNFGGFNLLWIGIGFYLQSADFGLNGRQIGAFSLLAVSAAMAAPFLGRLADKLSTRHSACISLLLIACGWILMLVVKHSLISIGLGIILIGIGAIGTDVTLRTALFNMAPGIRMRLNSVYTAGAFVGGALFSFTTGVLWSGFGWEGISITGFCATALAVSLALYVQKPADT